MKNKIISVDVGGTTTKFALVDIESDPKIVYKESRTTQLESYDDFINDIFEFYELQSTSNEIKAISIAVPGKVIDGISQGTPSLTCIKDKDICKSLLERIGKELLVLVDNDAIAAINSEILDSGENQFMTMVIMGTAIGGSTIFNGNIMRGFSNEASSFSAIFDTNDDYSRNRIGMSTVEMSKTLSKYKHEDIDGKETMRLFREGDSLAVGVVKKYFRKLVGLAFNIEYIINPKEIVFAGGITEDEEFLKLFHETRDLVLSKNPNLGETTTQFRVSKHKQNANLIGLANIIKKEIKNERI